MATSTIDLGLYKLEKLETGSQTVVNGWGFTQNYTAPSGYELYQPLVIKTPNDNWITGFATKTSATQIAVSGQNMFSGSISGKFTLLLIYRKVGA